jgi:hypothetical protein
VNSKLLDWGKPGSQRSFGRAQNWAGKKLQRGCVNPTRASLFPNETVPASKVSLLGYWLDPFRGAHPNCWRTQGSELMKTLLIGCSIGSVAFFVLANSLAQSTWTPRGGVSQKEPCKVFSLRQRMSSPTNNSSVSSAPLPTAALVIGEQGPHQRTWLKVVTNTVAGGSVLS